MEQDHYKVLGVDRTASADDIKRAYRKLSKELHPDRNKDSPDAERKFQEVNVAYETLSDPQKRRMYDRFGSAAGGGGGQGGFGGFDFSGFSGADASGFGDIFESFFGGGARGASRQSDKGEDMEIRIRITLKEAFAGTQTQVRMQTFSSCESCSGSGTTAGSELKTCGECQGTGQVVRMAQSFFGAIRQSMACPACQGSGKIPESACKSCSGEGRTQKARTVVVSVPAGIHDGQTLRLRGEGGAGRRGGEAGDLFVHMDVTGEARMRREGDDVHCEESVHVLDAILGTEVAVETLHGSVQLKIPAGTQSHQIFRIKSKGMPILGTSRFGDQYVRITLNIPEKLSREEQKILREWKQLREK